MADPKPTTETHKPNGVVLPHIKGMSEAQRGVEITPSIDYWNNPANTVTKTPSFGGGTSLGMVQRPPWHNDMRDYSEGGMVIRPPDTGDDMVITPGTSWLTSGPPLRRFWNLLEYGADRMVERLIPSAGKT
jgi:hypothetical protein